MNKMNDECDLCQEQAIERRITHWKEYKFCDRCAKAYDLGVRDMDRWQKGRARMDKGSDPF